MKPAKPLKDRLTKRVLERLRTRKVTNKEVAREMGVSESYLSRIVAGMQTKEPGQTVIERNANAQLAKTRRHFRTKLAKEVIRNRKTCTDAAAEAGCSERTMFRYIARYKA